MRETIVHPHRLPRLALELIERATGRRPRCRGSCGDAQCAGQTSHTSTTRPAGPPPSVSATSRTEARAYSGLPDTVDPLRAGKAKPRSKGRISLPDRRVTVNRAAQHHFAAIAILLATIGPQAALALPTMEEALSAYQLHLYGSPVEVLRMHAEQGNAVAQSTLGQMYVDDTRCFLFCVPEDDAEAARWLHLAAEQGRPDAQLRLGAMYFRGEGVPQNDAEAMRWLRLAADQGNESAQRYLKNTPETGIPCRFYRLILSGALIRGGLV